MSKRWSWAAVLGSSYRAGGQSKGTLVLGQGGGPPRVPVLLQYPIAFEPATALTHCHDPLPQTRLESLFTMGKNSPKIRHKGVHRCKGHSQDLGGCWVCSFVPTDTHFHGSLCIHTPLHPFSRTCLVCPSSSLPATNPPEVGSVWLSPWSCPPKAREQSPPEQRQTEEQWPHHDPVPSQAMASWQFDGGPSKVPSLSRQEGVLMSLQTSCCPQRQARAWPGAGAVGHVPPGGRAGMRGHGLSVSDLQCQCPGQDSGSSEPTKSTVPKVWSPRNFQNRAVVFSFGKDSG